MEWTSSTGLGGQNIYNNSKLQHAGDPYLDDSWLCAAGCAGLWVWAKSAELSESVQKAHAQVVSAIQKGPPFMDEDDTTCT